MKKFFISICSITLMFSLLASTTLLNVSASTQKSISLINSELKTTESSIPSSVAAELLKSRINPAKASSTSYTKGQIHTKNQATLLHQNVDAESITSPIVAQYSSALAGTTALGPNLIFNGDFEFHPLQYGSWVPVWDSNKQDPEFYWDSGIFHGYGYSGHSLLIEGTSIDAAICNQIQIKPGQQYLFSFWNKALNVTRRSDELGLFVALLQIDAYGDVIYGTDEAYLNYGTFDWTNSTFTFTAAPNARSVFIMLGLDGSGTVWFDDVSLNSLTTPTPTPIPTPIPTPTPAIPHGAIALNFTPFDSVIDPNRPVIYLTDRSNNKIYAVNYITGEMKHLSFDNNVQHISIRGNELYANLIISDYKDYYPPTSGLIAIIDTSTFSYIDSIYTDFVPYDVEVDNDGNIHVTNSGGWGYMKSYNRTTKKEISKIFSPGTTLLEMSPVSNKLYAITTNLSPSDFYAYNVSNGKYIDPSGYDSPYHGDYSLDTNYRISPDGKYLFNGSGDVFYCSENKALGLHGLNDNRNSDMAHAFSLHSGGFSDITFDPENNRFFTGHNYGIISTDYHDFKPKGYITTSGKAKWLYNTQVDLIVVASIIPHSGTGNIYYIEKINKNTFGTLPDITPTPNYSRTHPFTAQNAANATSIEVGKTIAATLPSDPTRSCWFKFQSKLSGTYIITYPPEAWGMNLYDERGFDVAYRSYTGNIVPNLEANKTYYLRIGNGSTGEKPITFSVTLDMPSQTSPDCNKDGKVDIDDLVILSLAFSSDSTNSDGRWDERADLNKDGKVDAEDFYILKHYYGT